ncbi:MAG: hypothetical protein QOH81_299 [Sphingomonadales bacterium]|nr:hypothetical protein [Sphingomonadales bacterium]
MRGLGGLIAFGGPIMSKGRTKHVTRPNLEQGFGPEGRHVCNGAPITVADERPVRPMLHNDGIRLLPPENPPQRFRYIVRPGQLLRLASVQYDCQMIRPRPVGQEESRISLWVVNGTAGIDYETAFEAAESNDPAAGNTRCFSSGERKG